MANISAVSTMGVVSGARIVDITNRGMRDLQIKARSPRQHVSELSGGNQQKVVLAKMLARSPQVLLMDEPTRGIDVGTKAEIYRLIRELAEAGTAVITVSSELPELIGMSDRILIMHEGRISGEVAAAEADEELLLAYCYGKSPSMERRRQMTTSRNLGVEDVTDVRAVPRRSVGQKLLSSGTVLALVVLILFFFAMRPDVFLSFTNVKNILYQVAILAIIAGAQTIVMVVGDFDLSVAATSALAGAVAASLMLRAGRSRSRSSPR